VDIDPPFSFDREDTREQNLVDNTLPMNTWIAKPIVLAVAVTMIAIRAPHGRRSRSVKVATSHKTALDTSLLVLAWVGFFVPLIWVASPVLSFAEYPLTPGRLIGGVMCFVVGLWLFYRSHADLGTNWSITLEVREHHRLITQGVYYRIRHPMHSALVLCSLGHALVIPNWVAGPANLVAIAILFTLRVHAEEQMMMDTFGDEYATYTARTKRLYPRGLVRMILRVTGVCCGPIQIRQHLMHPDNLFHSDGQRLYKCAATAFRDGVAPTR
jgi:protein-S-isoprenylcysteine O-methyltransferase Ste14